ncbi:MAG: PaaI family thioesterase [Sphingopyxis sp.]|nr:PaaI family thioesterase [Sphingopyxis sp.]
MSITLPPYAAALGIIIETDGAGEDAPVLRMDFSDGLSGRPGNLHGGAIAGLLDMAAWAAMRAMLDAGEGPARFKPIGITIDYLRGGKHRPTYARGRVTKVGSRVATVVVEAWQEERAKPIAAARLHFMLGRSEAAES